MSAQAVEHFVNLREAPPFDRVPKEGLVAVVVPVRIKLEQTLTHILALQIPPDLWHVAAQIHAKAGQNACKFLDVALRITAIHAERVQFHQLECVVLIEMANSV